MSAQAIELSAQKINGMEAMLRPDGTPMNMGSVAYQNYLDLAAQIPENMKDVWFRVHYMKYFLPRKGDRILDLGAYMGANLLHYGLLGHICEGVEGAKNYVERFHEEMEFHPTIARQVAMHHCLIEEFEPTELFDAVCCGEVLEFSQNPHKIIAKAHECLKDGGKAFFAVLNNQCPPHLNKYTRERLRDEMGMFKNLRSTDTRTHFVCQGVK